MHRFLWIRFAVWTFSALYAPGSWSPIANEILYPLIHNIHRSARKANITTGVTNLLEEEVQVNRKLLKKISRQPPLSQSTIAIYAADCWKSDNSTTRDVYDTIVKTSREVTPMCRFPGPPFRIVVRIAGASFFLSVGPMWGGLGYSGYKWPTRSVEQLPPFRPQKLRNQILVLGNTADPVTPLASARFVAELLGDQAVMVEQLGFGHTTLAEYSSCTERIVADHITRGIVSLFCLGI